jgi:hypothetical protein
VRSNLQIQHCIQFKNVEVVAQFCSYFCSFVSVSFLLFIFSSFLCSFSVFSCSAIFISFVLIIFLGVGFKLTERRRLYIHFVSNYVGLSDEPGQIGKVSFFKHFGAGGIIIFLLDIIAVTMSFDPFPLFSF